MKQLLEKMTTLLLVAIMTITPLTVLAAEEPPESTEFAMTINMAMEAIPAAMDALEISGIIIAFVDSQTGFTWTQGFGYADSITGNRVDEHTLFQVGSTSKIFTALAVMELVDRGLVDLDTAFVYYVPEFTMQPGISEANSDDVTIRMLLSNTSGVHRDFFYAMLSYGKVQSPRNIDGMLDWLSARDMQFVPGTSFQYANNNWALLNILVARVIGADDYFHSFVNFTNDYVFTPLGMNDSSFMFPQDHNNVAMPYLSASEQDARYVINIIGPGAMLSSAYEMAIFMHQFFSNDLLAQMIPAQTTHVLPETSAIQYGLGILHMEAMGFEMVGHGGNMEHFHTEFIMHQETGLGIFISTNTVTGLEFVHGFAVDMVLLLTCLLLPFMKKQAFFPLIFPS